MNSSTLLALLTVHSPGSKFIAQHLAVREIRGLRVAPISFQVAYVHRKHIKRLQRPNASSCFPPGLPPVVTRRQLRQMTAGRAATGPYPIAASIPGRPSRNPSTPPRQTPPQPTGCRRSRRRNTPGVWWWCRQVSDRLRMHMQRQERARDETLCAPSG